MQGILGLFITWTCKYNKGFATPARRLVIFSTDTLSSLGHDPIRARPWPSLIDSSFHCSHFSPHHLAGGSLCSYIINITVCKKQLNVERRKTALPSILPLNHPLSQQMLSTYYVPHTVRHREQEESNDKGCDVKGKEPRETVVNALVATCTRHGRTEGVQGRLPKTMRI